jgi:hypothetical protein
MYSDNLSSKIKSRGKLAALAPKTALCSSSKKQRAGPVTASKPASAPPIFGLSRTTNNVTKTTMAAVTTTRERILPTSSGDKSVINHQSVNIDNSFGFLRN